MVSIPSEQEPALGPWLVEAAQGIAVIPMGEIPLGRGRAGEAGLSSEWWVELNNGLGGHAGVGTIIARCTSELEAELVACALWVLVGKLRE